MVEKRQRLAGWVAGIMDWFSRPPKASGAAAASRFHWRPIAGVLGLLLLILCLVSWYWSRTPQLLWVNDKTPQQQTVVGYSTTDTLIRVAETLSCASSRRSWASRAAT